MPRAAGLIGLVLIAAVAAAATAQADTAEAPATPASPPLSADERLALLPPIDFNLEEDTFANEPISDADPDATAPRRRRGGPPFGSSAPVSLGAFWAPAVNVGEQDATLAMNAEFARVATPIGVPAEGKPLWLAIGKFGRLELVTDAGLPTASR